MEYYENPSYETLVELDGIGDVKACSVYDWCRFTKSDAVKNLMIHILMEELEVEKPAQKVDQSLKGLTFVITGNVHIYKNRDEFKASVEARGGKVSGSVSSAPVLVSGSVGEVSSVSVTVILPRIIPIQQVY